MTACVEISANAAVLGAHQEDGLPPHMRAEVIAWLWQDGVVAQKEPTALEDAAIFVF
jgi:hypothetical protein